ncbi:hypothetical protein [Roseobacter sp.]|uniref:hypothetical protein n=1 Tax=Roseobacter sp. TaxID=1907202 RepID=UPI0025EF7851|nr:hypothetical protein [Roseobacter sp.]
MRFPVQVRWPLVQTGWQRQWLRFDFVPGPEDHLVSGQQAAPGHPAVSAELRHQLAVRLHLEPGFAQQSQFLA